jgi:ATP-binding cassette subfamily F protein 3
LTLLSGTVTEGKGLNIGYFAQQELDVLRPDDSPLAHMIRLARDTEAAGTLTGQSTREQDLRNFLGSFQFSGDMVQQPVGTMSGGEKARLVLCMIVWQRPNLLLLDEPTNHLDLATRQAQARAPGVRLRNDVLSLDLNGRDLVRAEMAPSQLRDQLTHCIISGVGSVVRGVTSRR